MQKRDLQLFIKRLRKYLDPKEIRYYACGEYGDKMGRPHYHMALFNHQFIDLQIYRGGQYKHFKNQFSTAKNQNPLYTSHVLEGIWKKGYCTIGELSFESAGYVARYVTKKITGPPAKEHYNGKAPEFALMSRMPGIGKPWLDKYFTDVYPKDFFTINGVKNKPPRYYDDQLKKLDPNLHIKLKEARQLKAKEEEIIRLKQREKHKNLTVKQLQRNLENGQ